MLFHSEYRILVGWTRGESQPEFEFLNIRNNNRLRSLRQSWSFAFEIKTTASVQQPSIIWSRAETRTSFLQSRSIVFRYEASFHNWRPNCFPSSTIGSMLSPTRHILPVPPSVRFEPIRFTMH